MTGTAKAGESPAPSAKPRGRILFVQTQAENAGAQEISRLIGQGLEARGFEVHHLFLYRVSAACDGLSNVVFVARERPSGPLRFGKFLWRLVREIRRIRPDVALCFQHYGNVIAAPAARLAGVPLVVANHVSARSTINTVVRKIDRMWGLCGVYHAITVNSKDLYRDYADYPARYRDLIAMIPHGFEDKTAGIDRVFSRRHFGLPQEAKVIGSVSRLHPLKQIDLAIRLLPERPGLHLAMAGQGPDAARLRQLAETLNVLDRVHLVGELPGSEIGRFLAMLDVFVFPTAAETFGLAAVEAAQAGVPVVANDLPVLREVLAVAGEPCALFVDAADTAAFGDAVDRVLSDEMVAEALARQGRRLSETYPLDGMIDAYAAIIEGRGTNALAGAVR